MVIRSLTPNIVTLSTPFARFGKIRIGGRGTVVKLTSGNLAVFSPVALTPDVQTTLTNLGGEVKYLTAPDLEHHIFLGEWHKAFPNAHIIGPEGLAEKRAKQKNENVPFSTIFTAKDKAAIKVSEEFDQDFEYEYVDAHPNKELVFFYKPERTLIEADLFFNLPATEQYSKTGEPANKGLFTKLFAPLWGTQGSAIWQKRMLWYAMSRADRPGFNASVKRINEWDFDAIVPCHGDSIEKGGKPIFEKLFSWHL